MMVKVHLKGRFGYGRPRVYYGPGVTEVPEGLAAALGLKPIAEEAEKQADTQAENIEAPDGQPPEVDPLADFPLLHEAGYTSVEQVRAASDEELLDIKGIGPATLKEIRAALEG